MKIENSGDIYLFPLQFNLGYAYAQFLDFSDESSFDGRMIYVFNFFEKSKDNLKPIKEIINLGFLFGPVPITRKPNIKGKAAWKYIGKDENFIQQFPLFKEYYLALLHKDWSKIGPWKIREPDFRKSKEVESYEEVRNLEIPAISSTWAIEIRATMQYLISIKKDVAKYYNLMDVIYWNTYVELANTSYPKDKATELLKKIDDKPLISHVKGKMVRKKKG